MNTLAMGAVLQLILNDVMCFLVPRHGGDILVHERPHDTGV